MQNFNILKMLLIYRLSRGVLKKFIAVLFVFTLLVVASKPAYAQDCPTSFDDPTLNQIACPLLRITNTILMVGGSVFVLVIIIGAFKYFTSMGDPKGVMGAKSTLTYGVLGFIIVTGAFAIFWMISNVLGLDLPFNVNPFEALDKAIKSLLCEVTKPPLIKPGSGFCP